MRQTICALVTGVQTCALPILYPRSKPRTSGFAAEAGKCLHEGFQNFLIHQSEEQAIWALLESFPYELEYYETKNDRSLEACVSKIGRASCRERVCQYV